ncbi:MAG: acylphosphatase [Oligoflexia bacterium]|nr:acylphosphatase [Oligoflexia bacterium]
MAFKAVRIVAKGRVQGVGFRAWCCSAARNLNLTGWVRNEENGDVSAVIEGPEEQISEMLALLRHGPPRAHVDSVDVFPSTSPQRTTFVTE